MNFRLEQNGLALASAALFFVAGCGGGDATPAAPTSTNVSVKVIDGAIKNALVCLDKNGNGRCDVDETQGTTDVAGNVTLAVPNADVGKYPLIAIVGTNAIDSVYGPVTVAYTLSAPADQVAVVSPLTTLVQQTVATTGATTAAAAQTVQNATGITVSLFQDYTQAMALFDGSIDAATVARMVVITTQRQAAAIAATLGTMAIDGTTITQADLDKAIQKKVLDLLPNLVTALSDPAVTAATGAAKETALLAAANTLVTSLGLTPASVPTVVAINTQTSTTTAVVAATPAASIQLQTLNFSNASTYFVRLFTGSLAQNTPDAGNNIQFVDRRTQNISGNVATWGSGANPSRNADLHWNGSTWVNCPLNFANTASVRDARGNSNYDYCDKFETGTSNRATFDVSGKLMSDVYAQVRAAGYKNLTLADVSVLGSATFPTGSKLFYQASTPLTTAFSYYPGSSSPVGVSDVVNQYSAAVSAGGDATAQAAGVACNSPETFTNGASSTTLEGMIGAMTGTPCLFAAGGFTYLGVFYPSGTPNEWWGNSTASIGVIGTAPINSGTAPGFFTGNTRIRIAFKGTGTNPVTYYACKERFNNGSSRNCAAIGTGSYTITTLGDGRVLTLTNPPAQAAPLNYARVFVERAGSVYYGYQSKPNVSNTVRLNSVAATAFLTQLGVTPSDPSMPVALTAGSYQGVWDVRDPAGSATNGTTVFLRSDGTYSCQNRFDSLFFSCSLTFTNVATGAFAFANLADGATASGTLDFLSGIASGTYHDPTTLPQDGTFVGHRR